MNADRWFQLWLTLISLALCGIGVVLWYFARKVMEMPAKYATKVDLEQKAQEIADDHERTQKDNRDERLRMHKENREDLQYIRKRLDDLANQQVHR